MPRTPHYPPSLAQRGILPPSMRRMARIVSRGAPPAAFQAGACSRGGIPNPATKALSDKARGFSLDKEPFSAATLKVKTWLRYY